MDKEKPKTMSFGIFIKVNFVNSFNRFKREKDKLIKETIKDIEGE